MDFKSPPDYIFAVRTSETSPTCDCDELWVEPGQWTWRLNSSCRRLEMRIERRKLEK